MTSPIIFRSRKWVKPEDLNPNGSLFGGRLLQWIDEEAALFAITALNNPHVVTRYISEIDFRCSPKQGDIIEIGLIAIASGQTSITMSCEVRNALTHCQVLTINKIVFVNLDDQGQPKPHNLSLNQLNHL
jgi:acyl-CoA hydrolase